MRRGWFGPPRGSHRGHEPGSILDGGAKAKARALAPTTTIRVIPAAPAGPPVVDTVAFDAFDAAALWSGSLLARKPTPEPEPVRWSPVRHGVLVTARASSFRFPLTCFTCHAKHRNLNADGFRDLYASAAAAGWRQDLFGSSWRCPRCFRRHDAVFGVRPVAAIQPAQPSGEQLCPQTHPSATSCSASRRGSPQRHGRDWTTGA